MSINRVRSKKVASLAALFLLATFTIGVAVPVAFAPPASAATGTLTGTVYNDFDADGIKDAGEPGVQGAVVYAYDVDGNQFGPVTSNGSGSYTFNLTGVTAGAMRVELQSMPAGFQPSRVGTNNASTIRFVTLNAGATVTNLHFAIQKPLEFCQANPDIVTTLFCVGNGAGAFDLATVFHSTYDSQTRTPAGTMSLTGSVEGVAWDPVTQRVFVSSYVKRHVGLNDSWGADAIYAVNPASNVTAHWVDLVSLGIDVGASAIPTNAARNLVNASLLSQDPIFGEVGKTGIGDIETNGVDTLYVTNLFQRTVHSMAIPANGAAPTTSTNLGLPGSAVTCTNGTARPFALAYQDGYVYSGIVCDAASGTTANLDAYVVRKLATDTTTGGWAQFGPRVDLDYNKGPVFTGVSNDNSAAINKWHIWDDSLDASWDSGRNSGSTGAADFMIRPTPMLSDIEFDDDGSMVLAFRDRTADMIGADNLPPDAADRGTPTWTGDSPAGLIFAMSGGDILRVCLSAGTFVIDGATAACPNHNESGAVANTGQGPNGGEFYSGDSNAAHQEISNGHVAIAPRSGQLLLSALDAVQDTTNSSGVRGLSNTTGARIDAITANYYTSERPATGQARFGKANGMGDLEVLCNAAPLEIGNRIWSDTNGNGIQDPAEVGIDGVTVRLYAASDTTFTTPLGTAVTSDSGQYYFRSGFTDSNLTNNVGGGLGFRSDFVIRIGTAANYTGSGPLAGLVLSPANQLPSYTYAGNPDAIDSDPASGGSKATMGSSWFPTIAVAASTTLPGFNNHTYDAGFVPPKPYDVALRKTVVSMNGAPSTGTVTFQLEVFNQTADSVNGVTITDYIDTASFKPMTVLPAAGTTGGAAALGYVWENASTTAPSVTISGVIPGNSSVTLNVTLAIATPVNMAGLLNTSEISKFDNDGNPATGDSTTGTVYDVDSIPDAVNTDVKVDDVINLKRWTNTSTAQTQNTAVVDEDDHDIATLPLYDLALIKTRSVGQSATVTSPANTASFDITVKNQGQTPVFNVTVLDSPVSPLARSASTAASQSVTTTLGAAVTVTFNSTTGVFTIPALAAGDTVKFTVIADLALVNTVQVNGAEITAFDNDNNSGNTKPSWVQDVDSTPDATVGNDALQAGTDPSGFPEDSHNDIDNAPVNGVNAADEDDQDTEAVRLGLLRLGSTVYKDANGNGTGDAGEEVAGVLVTLLKFNGTMYDTVGSTVTNANGDYSFDRLFPGTYQVGLPAAQTGAGVNAAALTEWEPVAGPIAGPEDDNFDNDGDASTGYLSRSDDVVLTHNGEPTNDAADKADADALTSPRTYTDTNSNLNVDFVFDQVTYELGNLVWSDNGAGNRYNNGLADSDESGINGVTVELYRDNGAGGAVANDGVLAASERIATTTTSGGGFYGFTGLTAGTDYHVVVLKSSVPIGLAVAGTPVTVGAADGIDNDNNAAVIVSQGWSSGAVSLGPVTTAEPTGEQDGTTGTDATPTESVADNRADQTIDFGFVPSLRIGNQVWRDESDNNPVTQVSTDNNGVFNASAGEVGLSGVRVELWRDVDGDGFQAGADDVLVGFTATDANGNYWFDGVRPGDTYVVAIPTIAGSAATIDRPASSDGQSASVAAADNDDDGAPDSSLGYLSVSRTFTPTLGTASINETDANQTGAGAAEDAANARAGANQYNDTDSQLRVDFGFVNVPVYRIGNLVWNDNGGSTYVAADENDGVADPNEPGIAGVEVQLFAAADSTFTTVISTATTDANGEYAFENLVAGNYVVRIPNTGSNATTLTGLASTIDGASANADADNDDNGVIASGGWTSSVVTLNASNAFQGAEPTDEARRATEAGTYDDGLSWTSVTTDPARYANNRSNLTVDFGFVAVYRIGNLVWNDANNDGIAQDGEPGIDGVLVQLMSGSTVVGETVTAGGGMYAFTNLAPGDYSVRIPTAQTPALGAIAGIVPAALNGLVSSDNTDANANNDEDNDDNGQVNGASSWDSGVVTLGGAVEPTDEQFRSDDAADDDADSFADNQSNLSVDFGFWPQMRLGNTVWIDQSDMNPVTYVVTDNNGVLDAGEAVLAGVGISVWLDGGDGIFDAGVGAGADDTLAGTDITDSEGNWLVNGLQPGTYFAAIENLPTGYETLVSSLGQSSADADVDNVDDGAAAADGSASPYVAVSGAVALTVGGEPSLESDAVPATDTDGDANAEAEANRTSGLPVRDSDSNLTVDFSFVSAPTYRIGNLVWLDTDRNGVADDGESGIPGALVRLLDSTGTIINETVTDATGAYAFTTTALGAPLGAGEYRIAIPSTQTQTLGLGLTIAAGALSNLSATTYAGDPDSVLTDSDSNGSAFAGGWQSTFVTLGGGTTTFETEPTSETLRSGDLTDDDFGWAAGTDARSEFTVDFGFFPGLRLGDTVWFDDGRTAVATYSAAQENDGIYQATELPAPGVDVELWADDGDGSFDAALDTYLSTQITDAQGEYFFLGLDESATYFAVVPSGAGKTDGANNNGTVLSGWRSSTATTAATDADNDTDHGDDLSASDAFVATSGLITPARGSMTYGESADEANANTKTGVTLTDGDSNLVVDFGFSPAPTYQLGNLVWLDANDNGIVDSGESGIGSVTVQLFRDDGDGVFQPGAADGAAVATATTGTTGVDKGRYEFATLAAGTYFVHLPKQSALNGMDSSQVREANANNDVDNDNNAIPFGGPVTGYASSKVELGAIAPQGENGEPTGEADGNTAASAENGAVFDERSNQTVDFGFALRARIGNQVWRDESDADNATHVSTDNNGAFDAASGEVGLAGVAIELWRDVAGDGIEFGDDDINVANTVTNAEGNYWFENLIPGTNHYVAISSVGAPLSTARSSAGISTTPTTADNDDDGAPVGSYVSVSQRFTVVTTGATLTEADAVEPGDGSSTADANAEVEANAAGSTYADAASELAIDFGFIEVPVYRIGNLVWLDANNDGVADSTETPLAGVLVQLLNGAGTVVAETSTDSNGEYAFQNVVAGDYSVRIPTTQVETLGGGLTVNATALSHLASSTTEASDPNADATDGDDNGVTVVSGWQSGTVTLGSTSDASATETEPTTEVDFRTAADDDTGWANGTDARSNVTVDFGFYQLLRLGDIVWLDNGGSGAGYNPANEDDGVFDAATETLISGVSVYLFRDGGDGVFDGGSGDDVAAGTTTTASGTYFFTGLTEGDYWVAIPETDLASGMALANLKSSTGQAVNDSTNDRDQGDPVTGWASVSHLVTLTAGAMSNGDSAFESRADTRTGITVANASSNLAIDFGFSPLPTYALGNLVWEDLNNDGLLTTGEPGIMGITVELYQDNGDGGATADDGILASSERVATTVTSSAGRYLFEDLAAGDYIVRIPATETDLDGWFIGGDSQPGVPVAAAGNETDNDNNAVADSDNGGGYTSGVVTLGEGNDHEEPTAEVDANTSASAETPVSIRDDRSDQTVDFGFWRGIRIGNQVWLDEGAGANQDNGVYDADETPVTGITVELWADNGDSAFDPASDTKVGTTTTGAEGRYFFEHVAPGVHFVAIPSGPVGTRSSTGRAGLGFMDDGRDDGEPVGSYVSVSQAVYWVPVGARTGEMDGPGITTDDAEAFANGVTGTYPDYSSYLTFDFGLVGVPLYRIGNLVWLDGNNDGLAQASEPGVDGVLVQLTNATGTVLAETVTSGGGKYAFESLAEGDYRVQIPGAQVPVVDGSLAASIVALALDGFYPSTIVSSTPSDEVDSDSNGVTTGVVTRSGLITLGGTEPVTEQVRVDDTTDDDLGLTTPRIDDDRSDFTVDFGYYSISLGNHVFFDANGNGVFEPASGDVGIDGVTVVLRDAAGVYVESTTTAGGGLYLFTGLVNGESYYVEVPANEFDTGGELNGLFSSVGDAGSTDDSDVDGLDRGVDPASPYGPVRSSGLWVATASAAPSATDGNEPNPDNDSVRPDLAENLVIDFGFYRMELGGTVFLDPTNDGLDGDDGDFVDITVLLYNGDGSAYLRADGGQATTQTDADGNYVFSGLPAGQYIVEIPALEFTQELAGYANSDGNDPVPSPDNDVTGEDNGFPVSGDIFSDGAVRSGVVTLNTAGEPEDDPAETSGYADNMSNLSVDFGFWQAQVGLELGNQVWFDSDKDGLFNHGESPVPAGVVLELLDAVSGTVLDTTVTDSNGQYLFTGLAAGRYIVKLPPVNFILGGPLYGYMATDGAGASDDPNDGNDSDSNALPLSVSGIKSAEVTLRASAPILEDDPASDDLDDRQSDLTVDFGLYLGTPLALTGADISVPLRQAGLLVGLGLMLLLVARRRNDEEETSS